MSARRRQITENNLYSDKYQQYYRNSICFKNCMKASGWFRESSSWLHREHPEKTCFEAQLQKLNCVIMHAVRSLTFEFCNRHPFAIRRRVVQDLGCSQQKEEICKTSSQKTEIIALILRLGSTNSALYSLTPGRASGG